uniref:Btz domain-containing protein n=1 Tax=Macrostomum lignano TaxID=282301 RepID=A0A1I8IH21_9PLAT
DLHAQDEPTESEFADAEDGTAAAAAAEAPKTEAGDAVSEDGDTGGSESAQFESSEAGLTADEAAGSGEALEAADESTEALKNPVAEAVEAAEQAVAAGPAPAVEQSEAGEERAQTDEATVAPAADEQVETDHAEIHAGTDGATAAGGEQAETKDDKASAADQPQPETAEATAERGEIVEGEGSSSVYSDAVDDEQAAGGRDSQEQPNVEAGANMDESESRDEAVTAEGEVKVETAGIDLKESEDVAAVDGDEAQEENERDIGEAAEEAKKEDEEADEEDEGEIGVDKARGEEAGEEDEDVGEDEEAGEEDEDVGEKAEKVGEEDEDVEKEDEEAGEEDEEVGEEDEEPEEEDEVGAEGTGEVKEAEEEVIEGEGNKEAESEEEEEDKEEAGVKEEDRAEAGVEHDEEYVEEAAEAGSPSEDTPKSPEEDESDPAFVPRRGNFYMHDLREEGSVDTAEASKQPRQAKRGPDAVDKWRHDRFDQYLQSPKTPAELVKRYGFDIRHADGAAEPAEPQRPARPGARAAAGSVAGADAGAASSRGTPAHRTMQSKARQLQRRRLLPTAFHARTELGVLDSSQLSMPALSSGAGLQPAFHARTELGVLDSSQLSMPALSCPHGVLDSSQLSMPALSSGCLAPGWAMDCQSTISLDRSNQLFTSFGTAAARGAGGSTACVRGPPSRMRLCHIARIARAHSALTQQPSSFASPAMEIDLPLYSLGPAAICSQDFGLPASQVGDASADGRVSPSDVCVAVKCEDEDFLKDILDLSDSLSPPDSGCHTGQSTPAHYCEFPLAFSPPPSPLDESEEVGAAGDDEDDGLSVSDGPSGSSAGTGISDYDLVSLSIKDLNLRLRHLPKSRVLQLKHRRRTLKNRQYAHVCRLRRQKTQAELATESVGMARQIASLRLQLDRANRERDLYRDELRRPGLPTRWPSNPRRFSIQRPTIQRSPTRSRRWVAALSAPDSAPSSNSPDLNRTGPTDAAPAAAAFSGARPPSPASRGPFILSLPAVGAPGASASAAARGTPSGAAFPVSAARAPLIARLSSAAFVGRADAALIAERRAGDAGREVVGSHFVFDGPGFGLCRAPWRDASLSGARRGAAAGSPEAAAGGEMRLRIWEKTRQQRVPRDGAAGQGTAKQVFSLLAPFGAELWLSSARFSARPGGAVRTFMTCDGKKMPKKSASIFLSRLCMNPGIEPDIRQWPKL